jgi:hypothetical protein
LPPKARFSGLPGGFDRSVGKVGLAPAEIDALSRARRAQQQAEKAMRRSAEQQLERRRYEAALAERQFNRVDPDNRLVASELERRWESALKEVRAAEEALTRSQSPQVIAPMAAVGKALNDNVIRLSGRLPERAKYVSTCARTLLTSVRVSMGWRR